jgi:hypothetical protein
MSDTNANKDDHEYRLQLRKKLRSVLEEVHNKKSVLVEQRNNHIFQEIVEKVRHMCHVEMGEHVRELNLDSAIGKELSFILKEQAQNLNDLSKRCDFDQLVKKLREKTESSNTKLNWLALGAIVIEGWNRIAPVLSMNGPIKKTVMTHAPVQRRQQSNDDKAVIEKPDIIINKGDDDKLDEATTLRLRKLQSHLHELGQAPTDLLTLLVDPKDPIQTMENFFDFSFLIKVSLANLFHHLPCGNCVEVV